jgi:hypothetical protein
MKPSCQINSTNKQEHHMESGSSCWCRCQILTHNNSADYWTLFFWSFLFLQAIKPSSGPKQYWHYYLPHNRWLAEWCTDSTLQRNLHRRGVQLLWYHSQNLHRVRKKFIEENECLWILSLTYLFWLCYKCQQHFWRSMCLL